MHFLLCIVHAWFYATTAELSSWKRSYGQQNLKYLLSLPLQKKFAGPYSKLQGPSVLIQVHTY